MRFRIDGALYDKASPEREREWRLAVMELNAEGDGGEPTLTLYRRRDGGVDVHVSPGGEGAPRIVELSYARMRTHFREYRNVIRHLARAGSGPLGRRDMETLDYAKKLAHDEAGKAVRDALAGVVEVDHRLGRRLFTLIFLVSSELPENLVRRHLRRGGE